VGKVARHTTFNGGEGGGEPETNFWTMKVPMQYPLVLLVKVR
jgi:hypothetical protein